MRIVKEEGRYYEYKLVNKNGEVVAHFHRLENLYKKFPPSDHMLWERGEEDE